MGFLARIIVSLGLLLTVVLPGLAQFGVQFPTVSLNFMSKTVDFVNLMAPYFASVRGAINYVISSGVGNAGIIAFDVLIKVGLMFPIFALSTRLYMSIRNYVL